jgi:hypothetical protein
MTRQPRLLTMIALVTALFLRVWVPAGWMPAANDGAFAIEPCAAAAPAVHVMDGKASHHDPSHKGQHDGDCAFAPHHAGMAASTQAPALAGPAISPTPLSENAPAPFFATGPPAPPPPATGPPAIA